jgi:hypothetical protein
MILSPVEPMRFFLQIGPTHILAGKMSAVATMIAAAALFALTKSCLASFT